MKLTHRVLANVRAATREHFGLRPCKTEVLIRTSDHATSWRLEDHLGAEHDLFDHLGLDELRGAEVVTPCTLDIAVYRRYGFERDQYELEDVDHFTINADGTVTYTGRDARAHSQHAEVQRRP